MIAKEKQFAAMLEPDFARLLDDDPELNALEAEKHSRAEELPALLSVLSGVFVISGVPVQTFTPALWSLLWAVDSPYVDSGREPGEIDTDIFLYLLATGIKNLDCGIAGLPEKAAGFCRRRGLDYAEARRDLKQMIAIAFRPLEMLPSGRGAGGVPVFDADWLTALASAVCRMTNYPADRVINELSLTECCYYFIQFRRHNGEKNIERRSNGEICEAIYRRTMTLGEEYCREKYGDAENVD